jgi:GntR family transcriptional repressor for pyruvate dehydrogenase complex
MFMVGDGQIVTASAAKQIAEHIRRAILDGRLKGAERLPTEEELANRYGVSRPTVREALKRLAAQNLISSRRGPAGGNFVNDLTLEELAQNVTSAAMMLVTVGGLEMDEIAEARIELEGLCCSLAVEHASDDVVSKLREALQKQSDPMLSNEDFCSSDVRFHRIIVDAAQNTMLRFVMYALIEALVPITNMVIVYVRDRSMIIECHQRMLAAMERRDAADLRRHLRALIGYLRESYAKAREQRDLRAASQAAR